MLIVRLEMIGIKIKRWRKGIRVCKILVRLNLFITIKLLLFSMMILTHRNGIDTSMEGKGLI
jgi:hypothetical protein